MVWRKLTGFIQVFKDKLKRLYLLRPKSRVALLLRAVGDTTNILNNVHVKVLIISALQIWRIEQPQKQSMQMHQSK